MFLSEAGLQTQFFIPIIILLGVATLTSFLISIFKLKFLPTFAIEIVIGLIIGPWFMGYMEHLDLTTVTNSIYNIGLVMIMFLSGYEVEFDVSEELTGEKESKNKKHNNIFKAAILITILTYATAILVSLFFNNYLEDNKVFGIIILTLVFASTFAGLVVPIIGNEGLLHTPIGKLLAAIANLSEALSILFLTILLIVVDIEREYWVILSLVAVLILLLGIVRKFKIGEAFFNKLTEGIDHLATRFIIVLILALVFLSELSGGEFILGAFLAGIFVRQAQFSENVIHSLTRIIYGVFAPMFYILVGTRIEIMHFFSDTHLLLLVLYCFIALLVVELPVLYLLKWYKLNTVVPSMILMSCTIVVPIAINHINEEVIHMFDESFGNALILASILMCVIGTILFEINFPFGNYKKHIHEG